MTPAELLLVFFMFVAAATAGMGYIFVIRPAGALGPQISPDLARDERGLPLAQAAVAGAFSARVAADAAENFALKSVPNDMCSWKSVAPPANSPGE